MNETKFQVIKDFGRLSENNTIYFRKINWNGTEKYDIRRWSKNDPLIPYKGITLAEHEKEELLKILKKAISSKKSTNSPRIIIQNQATVTLYADFGVFSGTNKMKKHVTYLNWGREPKYDIRAWSDDFATCKKGISLTQSECEKLIFLIENKVLSNNNFDILFKDFVIRTNTFYCNKKHNIKSICAVISLLDDTGKVHNSTVSAGYCEHCKLYFILEKDYQRLRRIGLPLCRQIKEKDYLEKGDSIFNGSQLNPESMLKQIGYSVSSEKELSIEQRHNILAFAIESGLYSISGICSFLDWLIDRAEKFKDRNMLLAIDKWKYDRKYISQYKIGTRPIVGIRSLKGRFL